jgi:serine/threonine protein kinase
MADIEEKVRDDVYDLFKGWSHYEYALRRLELFAKFDRDELKLGKEMGRGQFGVVCALHGIDMNDSVDPHLSAERKHLANNCIKDDETPRYAVKCINPDLATTEKKYYQAARDLAVEAHCLSALDHPNIVKLRGLSTSAMGSNQFFMILDMLPVSLLDRLERWHAKERKLSGLSGKMRDPTGKKSKAIMCEKLKIGYDLINAISFLHKNNIIHRDVKPENVGFDVHGDLRVFDFGLSLEYDPKWDKPYDLPCNAGTMRYMAPEVFLKKGYDETVDVYAFGIILWEILSVQKPFSGMTEIQFKEVVMKRGTRPQIDKHWPKELQNLLNECWSPTYDQRPSSKSAFAALRPLVENADENKGLRHSVHEMPSRMAEGNLK